jgi:hypothetical protein
VIQISLATLIFSGDLAPYLARAIVTADIAAVLGRSAAPDVRTGKRGSQRHEWTIDAGRTLVEYPAVMGEG